MSSGDAMNALSHEGVDLTLLAAREALKTVGDSDVPINVFNLSRATEKYKEWNTYLPRVTPHYAVKCNPDDKFLRQLRSSGCSFDCATKAEIHQVLAIGASPDSIVFSHPCKVRSDLQFAKARNVRLMSFDNATELKKVAAEFPEARLLLRLVCEDTSAQCPMSAKFGAVPMDWDSLLSDAEKLGLNMVGVSFHVGSGCKEPAAFEKALSDAKEVFKLAAARGFTMDVLDIGGGYPGEDSPELSFAALATRISKQLDHHFPVCDFPNLRTIAEPGRFFAHSAASLLTKVIAKAQPSGGEGSEVIKIEGEPDSANFRYYMNDGVYGSFNCIIYDHAEAYPEKIQPVTGPPQPCWIFGPTCDGFDVILSDYKMPELQEGEWVLWRNMGAYTSAAGSRFNGFPLARTLYFNGADSSNKITFHQPEDSDQCSTEESTPSHESVNLSLPEASSFFSSGSSRVTSTTLWGQYSPLTWAMFLLISFLWGARTVSFSWAVSRTSFSPFTTPIVHSALLAVCTFVGLAIVYGREEVCLMMNRRYLAFSISGVLEGLMFCLLNLALTKASATAVTVLMQGQLFVVVFLQAAVLRIMPTAVQVMCVSSALCLLFSYQLSMSTRDDVSLSFASGVVPAAFGAAFCSGACDLALEYFSKRSMSLAVNQKAEVMRCLVFHELFKIPIACAMLFAFDGEITKAGFFHGWDYSVVLGGAGASALSLAILNPAVVLLGSLPINLFTSLEVAFVYLLDTFVLRTDAFNLVTLLQMGCFVGMAAAYNLDVLSVLTWETSYAKITESQRPSVVGRELTSGGLGLATEAQSRAQPLLAASGGQ